MMLARGEEVAELRDELADVVECVKRCVDTLAKFKTDLNALREEVRTLRMDVEHAQDYTVARFQGVAHKLQPLIEAAVDNE